MLTDNSEKTTSLTNAISYFVILVVVCMMHDDNTSGIGDTRYVDAIDCEKAGLLTATSPATRTTTTRITKTRKTIIM